MKNSLNKIVGQKPRLNESQVLNVEKIKNHIKEINETLKKKTQRINLINGEKSNG